MQTAYLMAASCTLEAHQQRPEHAASLSLAIHMLRQAHETAEAIMHLPQSSRDGFARRSACQLQMVSTSLPDVKSSIMGPANDAHGCIRRALLHALIMHGMHR
jgi:hypothetical protein